MPEFSSKGIQQIAALAGAGIWLCYVTGIGANSDTLTVAPLTTVKGAFLISSTGTVGTMTFSGNVITVTNGGGLTWSGLAWGIP